MSLTPSVEVGLRQDGGDAETGTGVDVGGGLSFTERVDGPVAGRAGSDAGRAPGGGVHGAGPVAVVGLGPDPVEPLGFGAREAPSWGGDVQGAEALWRGGPLSQLGAYGGQSSAGRLDAELGYGLPVGRRLVGTPRVGFGRLGLRARVPVRLPVGGARDRADGRRAGGGRAAAGSPLLDGGDLGVLGGPASAGKGLTRRRAARWRRRRWRLPVRRSGRRRRPGASMAPPRRPTYGPRPRDAPALRDAVRRTRVANLRPASTSTRAHAIHAGIAPCGRLPKRRTVAAAPAGRASDRGRSQDPPVRHGGIGSKEWTVDGRGGTRSSLGG